MLLLKGRRIRGQTSENIKELIAYNKNKERVSIKDALINNDYFCPLCNEKLILKKGLKRRLNGDIPDKYKERLSYELGIIDKMGFSNYFLVVYDFIKYAKSNNILVGPGRGSAAGSLVAYCLGITEIDPMEYDLLFERFLNPERHGMPDIDTDFPDEEREKVIEYVRKKYGEKYVSGIVKFLKILENMKLK